MRATNRLVTWQELDEIAFNMGYKFEASADVTLAAGVANNVIMFNNSDKFIILSERSFTRDGATFTTSLYRDAEYTDETGTILGDIIHNANDIIRDTTSGVTFVSNPTIESEGTISRAPRKFITADNANGRGAPVQAITTPQYIRPNEKVLLRTLSATAQNLFGVLSWCELDSIPFYEKTGEDTNGDPIYTYAGVTF